MRTAFVRNARVPIGSVTWSFGRLTGPTAVQRGRDHGGVVVTVDLPATTGMRP